MKFCKNPSCGDLFYSKWSFQTFCSGACRSIYHNRLYRDRDPERRRRTKRKSYLKHRLRALAANDRWRRLNRDKVSFTSRKSIRKRDAIRRLQKSYISTITHDEWKSFLLGMGA